MTHANDVIRENRGSIHTLQARMGTGGNQIPLIYARPSYADLKQDEIAGTLKASGGCNGGGSENLVADYTDGVGTGGNNIPLTYDNGNVTLYQKDGKIGSLMARDYKGVGNDYVTQGKIIISDLKLRKLTPLECERLQGLPDNWTLIDDKTCSDSARYKAIGNGMAQPCADFVMNRIEEHEVSKHT